jgi:hypothetical protein
LVTEHVANVDDSKDVFSSADSPFSPDPRFLVPFPRRLRCLPSWGPTGIHPVKPHLLIIAQLRPSINGENLVLWEGEEPGTNEHSRSPNSF